MEKPQKESSKTSKPESWPQGPLCKEHDKRDGDDDNNDCVNQSPHEVTIKLILKTEKHKEGTDNDTICDR